MSEKLYQSYEEYEQEIQEESIIWSEKFSILTEQIKNKFSENFIKDDSRYFDSKKKHKWTYNGEVIETSNIKIKFGEEDDDDDNLIDRLTISMTIFYFKKEIIKGIFSENINLKKERIDFYPLHIKPVGLTDSHRHGYTFTYSDIKDSRKNKNIDWFVNEFWKSDYKIDIDFNLILFLKELQNTIDNFYEIEIKEENNKRREKLIIDKNNFIILLDKDNNGEVDLVDGESFNKLLTKNQKSVIEIDKNYIQKFVKISMYLKTKKSNTQKIFDSIKDTKNDTELNELVNLLKNQIHTYELLVFHSINMITSLVESDLITFYEIYECFDQLGVFNSNWENEVSDKLTNIGDGIKDLMYSIYKMENKIVNSINNLTYVTQDSFKELNMSVNNQLSGINSSIKFNNLLTGIQTYQMYKINQNTKRIN